VGRKRHVGVGKGHESCSTDARTSMRRSTRPCTISKPEVAPQNSAAALRTLRAPTSVSASSTTQSDTCTRHPNRSLSVERTRSSMQHAHTTLGGQ